MDINGIRLRNYRTLLLQFRSREDQQLLPNHGLLTRFAAAAKLSPRYLSHVNNGRKNIGESLARQIEQGLGLPLGWMDNSHEGVSDSATTAEAQFLEAARQIFRESPLDAQSLMLRFMMERKNSQR